MKKIYSFLFTVISITGGFSQTFITVGSNNGQGSFLTDDNSYGPMASNTTAGVSWNRHAYIYPASALTVLPSNSNIDSIFFSRITSGVSQGMLTGTVNFKIYLKNTAAADFGTGALAWDTEIATATLVYNADPIAIVGNTPDYKKFILTAPFVYTGNNIEILVEYSQSAPATGQVGWGYDNDNTMPEYVDNSVKYISGTSGTPTNSLTSSNLRHPALALFYTSNNPVDAALTSITVPDVSCYATAQSVSVILTNTGTTTIAPGAAAVVLNISGANSFTQTIANSLSLAAGASETLLFSGINISNPGNNFDTAFVTLLADPVKNNDTLITGSTTATTITSFPATEDAEGSFAVFSYTSIIAGEESLWFINQGKYGNTGLSDSLAPHGGDQFYIFDSYLGLEGSRTRLFSNCLSLPTGNPYSLTFWMSHDTSFATSSDSLYVSVSTDKGQTWNKLLPGFARYDPAFMVSGWKLHTVDLSAYAGQTIQLSFEGVSNFGNIIGLDDITILLTSATPVVLNKFDVQRSGSFNNITWSTSQENNTSHFIVERSLDSRNFQSVGQVKAAGNSSATLNYQFPDRSPVKGTNYYRLTIVDKDNTNSYSAIKSIRITGPTVFTITPNPVTDQLNANLDIEKSDKGTITITDFNGKQVYKKGVSVTNGSNTIRLDIGHLQKGSYIVKIGLATETIVQKFTKF